MGYCTSCTGCCQLCGDPGLESCADCDGTAPDAKAGFWATVGLFIVGLYAADHIKRGL